MLPLKRLVGLLIILGACAMPFFLQAQEKPAYMYLTEKAERGESQLESDTIYTGTVILYGELIPPPYTVEFKRDTVWVNNIPVNPSITPWYEEPPKKPRRVEISDSCGADYYSFRPHHSLEETKRMILDKYLQKPLVDTILFLPDSGDFTDIEIHFHGTWPSNVMVHRFAPDGTFLPSEMDIRRLSPEQKAAIKEGQADWARSELRKGTLLIFSRVFHMAKSSPIDQDRFVDCLRKIAAGQITVEQAKLDYPRLLPDADSFWEEFEHKKDTWK